MKVSACAIVKNEEKNMPRWLDCVKRLADEIIVVDTGSTDRTVEIARAHGVRLFHFEWINDFAAAKNYALDQATGEWIVFLDADEYFLSEDCPKVREIIQRYHGDPRVGGLFFNCLHIDPEKNDKYLSDGVLLRVFRNRSTLRYEGRIHELLISHGKRAPEMKVVKDISIRHTGYTASNTKVKAHRNLAILLAEQERRGERPEDNYYLMDCYLGLGEYDKALEYARRAIAAKVFLVGMENRPWLVFIQMLILQGRLREEVDEAIEKARREFPHLPEFAMMAGFTAYDRGAYGEAENVLQQGLELYRQQQAASCQDIYNEDQGTKFLPKAYECLGCLAALRGDDKAAVDYFVASLQREHSDGVLDRLLRVLRGRSPAEVSACLNQLYDVAKDAAWLVEKLYQRGLTAALSDKGVAEDAVHGAFALCIVAGEREAAALLALDNVSALAALAAWLSKRMALNGEMDFLLPHEAHDGRRWERIAQALM